MISVLVPAFNEEAVIAVTLDEIRRALDGVAFEVVVVDDGSTDRTATIVKEMSCQDARIRLRELETNRGKGTALREAFAASRGELVVFLDADMELHPRQIWALLEAMDEHDADVVVGTKHSPGAAVSYPWHRQLASRLFANLTHLLFDLSVRDTQTGIKLFRREALLRAFPRVSTRRYAFDVELLVAVSRFGYRVFEEPVEVSFSRRGWGRVGVASVARMAFDLLGIFDRASFWRWLQPSFAARVSMLTLVAGTAMMSFGIAHLLTLVSALSPPMERLAYILTLRFLDKQTRDWLLIFAGSLASGMALLQLNRALLAALDQRDCGDLAGIRRMPQSGRTSSSGRERRDDGGSSRGDGS